LRQIQKNLIKLKYSANAREPFAGVVMAYVALFAPHDVVSQFPVITLVLRRFAIAGSCARRATRTGAQ